MFFHRERQSFCLSPCNLVYELRQILSPFFTTLIFAYNNAVSSLAPLSPYMFFLENIKPVFEIV